MSRSSEIPMKRASINTNSVDVGTANWVSLVSTMADAVYAAEFFNPSGSTLEIGTGPGSTSVTVLQYYIIPGGPSGRVGLCIDKGQNVWLRAVDASVATVGLIVANFLR